MAIELLERHFLSDVERALAPLRGSPALAADVRQIVLEGLLVSDSRGRMGIASYAGRASLQRWVKIALIRAAAPLQRKQQRESVLDDEVREITSAMPALSELEVELTRAEYRAAFKKAVTQVSNACRHAIAKCYGCGT